MPNQLTVSLPTGSAPVAQYPLQFGRAFLPGAIAGWPRAVIDGVPAAAWQADVKTRHADGSVKFAVISLVLPLSTTEKVISFQNAASAAPGAPVTVASMLADYDCEATIDVRVADVSVPGAPASARAMLGALTDAALAAETAAGGVQSRYWTQGPVCTTVLLCDHTGKTWDMGTTTSKVMRPAFYVQFWPGVGTYRVRHVLELGDVTKLRDELGLAVTFTTGHAAPATRITQATVNLYAGTWLSREYWSGAGYVSPHIKHGLAYLSETGVIPNFDPALTVSQAVVDSYAADFGAKPQDFDAYGYWSRSMANTGGRPDLGLLPKWDVLAIYTGDTALQDISLRHCEYAGRWAFYFREGAAGKNIVGTTEGHGRVVSKLARPTLFLSDGNQFMSWSSTVVADRFTRETTLSSTRDGWTHDSAHTPGLFWWQYLSTGSAFWYEKLLQMGSWGQFMPNPEAAFNHLTNGRAPTDLIINGFQVRGLGWQYRNRARCWWAAVDGSPEKALFVRAMDDATAMLEGLHDLPGDFTAHPVRQAWNTNYLSFYNGYVSAGNMLASPRPNALGFMGIKGQSSDTSMFNAVGHHLPDDSGGGCLSPWMQSYAALGLWHAVELGYTSARAIAEFATRLNIAVATSSEPRHLGDYYFPDSKSDGGYYQTTADIYDGWTHNADSAYPPYMPADPASGFSSLSPAGTWQIMVEGYATSAAATIAMAASAPGQAEAWAVVQPWYSATTEYNDDPRYAIVPRATVPLPPGGAVNDSYTMVVGRGVYAGASGPSLSLVVDSLGQVGTPLIAEVRNTGGFRGPWTLSSSPAGLTATPSSGSTRAGEATIVTLAFANAATFALQLLDMRRGVSSSSSIVVSDPPPPPPPPAGPAVLAISAPSAMTVGVESAVSVSWSGFIAGDYGAVAFSGPGAPAFGALSIASASGSASVPVTPSAAGSGQVSATRGTVTSNAVAVTVGAEALLNLGDVRVTLFGQSNLITRALRTDLTAAPLSSDPVLAAYDSGALTFDRVMVWTGTEYQTLQPGVNTRSLSTELGFEFALGVEWMRRTASGTLYINKRAESGVSITTFLPPSGPNWSYAMSWRSLANSWLSARGITIAAEHCWMIQGETDYLQTQEWYQTRLQQIIDALYANGSLTAGSSRAVLTQMNASTSTYGAGVAAAKTAIAAANAPRFAAISYRYYMAPGSTIHYNGRGQVQQAYDGFAHLFGVSATQT